MKGNVFISIVIVILFWTLNSCEDPIPKDYIPVTLVEGLLVVGEPINNIKISKTTSIFEQYNEKIAAINDAKVYIYENENEITLALTPDSIGSYSDTQKNYHVIKSNTTYSLKIILNNGDTLKGQTTTPNNIEWGNYDFPNTIKYPDDTINLPTDTNIKIQWNGNPNNKNIFNIIALTCEDTLKYGKYLTPQTNEYNRRTRISNDKNRYERYARERTTTSMAILNQVPVMWRAFKWFGKHSLKIYVPDQNYEKWFLYFAISGNLNDKGFSIEGKNVAGYFGSAYKIEQNFMLLKNKREQ